MQVFPFQARSYSSCPLNYIQGVASDYIALHIIIHLGLSCYTPKLYAVFSATNRICDNHC